MRLVHVVPTYLPASRYGGPIQSVHRLCVALAQRGHDVDVVTTNVDGSGILDVPLCQRVCLDGIGIYYFPSAHLRRIYFSTPLYRHLSGTMATSDLVHTHSTFLFPTAAAAYLARRARVPYVLSPRGMLVPDLIRRKSRMAKAAWIGMIEARNVAGAAAIHVTSDIEALELRALGLRPRRIFEIPNGVDAPPVAVATPPSSLPPNYVLFLGRINWKKGIESLVEAIALQGRAHLVIAGNDEEGFTDSLRALAGRLAIEDRVHFTGFVQGENKQRLLASAGLLALASKSENFGNVVLEAMAAGVPVIVTPEVGLAPVVERTSSGIVCRPEGPALAHAMEQILSNPDARRTMAENGRRASASYSWSSVAQRMEAQYEDILASRPR
jgi:glycosyltransferase involved in cell wall biosynthesis